jgi:hypothetical protein
MFMNLHTLPAGQSMYTLFVTTAEEPNSYYEEIDVVASSRATKDQVIDAAAGELADYEPGTRVIGISDQSSGGWLFREEGWS